VKFRKVIQQPLFKSLLFHLSLLSVFIGFFWSKSQIHTEIPVEITEFIRHLGTPETKKTHSLNRTTTAPRPSSGVNANPTSQATSEETFFEDYEVSEMPLLINEVRVPYPSDARARGIQGIVVFDLLIGSDGKVKEVKALSSPDSSLTIAAQNAVSLFRFRPAKMGDKVVAIRIHYTYRFLLQ